MDVGITITAADTTSAIIVTTWRWKQERRQWRHW
jgi:hypothetical protein